MTKVACEFPKKHNKVCFQMGKSDCICIKKCDISVSTSKNYHRILHCMNLLITKTDERHADNE